jgi:hypothetical protein
MTVHKVLERMWKESVEPCLKVLCRIFSGGSEKNHEKPLSERWVFQTTFELLYLQINYKSKSQALSIERSCFATEVTILLLWETELKKTAFFFLLLQLTCYVVLLWFENIGMEWVSCIGILQNCKKCYFTAACRSGKGVEHHLDIWTVKVKVTL